MIELEGLLDINCKFLTTEEQQFIYRAKKFKYEDVVSFINMYNTSSPKPDELKLVAELATEKQMLPNDILKRIREVKRIKRYKDKQK